MQALLHSVPPTLQQATTDPRLHQRALDTQGQVWVSLLWGHCSFLLGPDAHKFFSCVPSKSLFPQSCVSSGSSMVGLMATSSKRAYAIPGSTAPRAPPLQQSTADSYLFRTHSNTVVSASVESLGPDFTPPTILLGLLLCTWMWGISSKSFQRHTATTPVPTILLGLLCPWMWGISSQYLQHQAATAPVPHSCSTTL